MSAGETAGSAYLVGPDHGPGPGVLVLHSWWGLTDGTRRRCNALADLGYTVLAPDLLPGILPETAAEAEFELAESDPNVTAGLVISSVVALRAHSLDPQAPVGVVGFSMGASWALWLAARNPDSVRAAVAYYGSQDVDFEGVRASVLGHFAERDLLVDEDEVALMHAHLRLAGVDATFHHYPGTSHWFAEEEQVDFFDPAAAELAWGRTTEFLHAALQQ